MIDPLPAADPLEDRRLLVMALDRDQHRHRPADRFLGGVTKKALCPAVPRTNDAVKRFTDDRVLGRFDNRRQAPGPIAGAGLGCLEATALRRCRWVQRWNQAPFVERA